MTGAALHNDGFFAGLYCLGESLIKPFGCAERAVQRFCEVARQSFVPEFLGSGPQFSAVRQISDRVRLMPST
jgi:hypothetical protein